MAPLVLMMKKRKLRSSVLVVFFPRVIQCGHCFRYQSLNGVCNITILKPILGGFENS